MKRTKTFSSLKGVARIIAYRKYSFTPTRASFATLQTHVAHRLPTRRGRARRRAFVERLWSVYRATFRASPATRTRHNRRRDLHFSQGRARVIARGTWVTSSARPSPVPEISPRPPLARDACSKFAD